MLNCEGKMANAAPSEKKARESEEKGECSQYADSDDGVHLALEEIDNCQSQIDSLNEQASEEILSVEMRYNNLRKPHYAKRGEMIAKISNFWLTSFLNHPQLSILINEEEQKCLQYLKNMYVEEFEDIKNGYKILFQFDPNPYFENETLVKEYHLMGHDGNPKMVITPIRWKPDKNLSCNNQDKDSRKRKANETDSFFSWFEQKNNITMDDIADSLKDEIWSNPMQFFLLPEVEEENGEGESDVEEEVEDEENEDN